MKNDALGDRMKLYEQLQATSLMPLLPAIARLDGRAFHTFTKDMERPYDVRLSDLMVAVTSRLVEEFSACCGYTQSDEITLLWYSDRLDVTPPFGGDIAKLNSILAATCSVQFNRAMPQVFATMATTPPVFDCRVWNVPSLAEAANVFLWRQNDATRNSIFMAGQAKFSHGQLLGRNGSEIQELLFQQHGINWNDYPGFFKRGSFLQRRTVANLQRYTDEELAQLPEQHTARDTREVLVERQVVVNVDLPRISQLLNREDVIARGAVPQTAASPRDA